MPKCTNCQSSVNEDDAECPRCGAVFEDAIKTSSDIKNESSRNTASNYTAIFVISALLVLVSMITTPPGTTLPSLSRLPIYYLRYVPGIALWLTAAIGIMKRDSTGIRLAKTSVGIIAFFNAIAVVSVIPGPTLGISVQQPVVPLDPVSSLVNIVLNSQRQLLYQFRFVFDLSIVVGSVGVILLVFYIHWNERNFISN